MKFAKNLCTMFILKLISQADRFFIVFRISNNFGLHGITTLDDPVQYLYYLITRWRGTVHALLLRCLRRRLEPLKIANEELQRSRKFMNHESNEISE